MTVLSYFIPGFLIILALASIWTRALAFTSTRSVPKRGASLSVGGGQMHFVDKGTAKKGTLVLIHGIAGQLQHFTYSMLDLLKDDYRVIAVDRPGCGYSTVTKGDGASLGDQARMIDELLAQLGVEKAVVVGHSLGGAVALRMGLDCPDRVAGLALLCPLTHAPGIVPNALKGLQVTTPWLRHLLGNTIAVPMGKITANKVLAEAYAPEACPDDFMIRAGAVLGLRPKAFVAACSDMTAVRLEMPAQSARYAGELMVPGGILFGADDVLLSPEEHGASMGTYNLAMKTLPGRGHMIPITAPQDCADFVRVVADQVL